MKVGTKVILKKTGQIGTIVDWDTNPVLAKVQIVTPRGPEIITVLKTLIEVIQIIDGIWPLIKSLWQALFPGKKKKVLLNFNDLPDDITKT